MKENHTLLDSLDSNSIKQLLFECFEVEEQALNSSHTSALDILQSYWESNIVLSNIPQQDSSYFLAQIQNEAYTLKSCHLVKDVILNPEIDLEMLNVLKEEYKQRGQEAESKMDKDIATIIYYASIAGGLVNHKKKITSYSYEQVEKAIAKLCSIEWLLTDIKRLFNAAIKYCIAHIDG